MLKLVAVSLLPKRNAKKFQVYTLGGLQSFCILWHAEDENVFKVTLNPHI